MRAAVLRLFLIGLAAAALIGVSGAAWELARFGTSAPAAATHLESYVRQTFADRVAALRAVTSRVTALAPQIEQAVSAPATGHPDAVRRLFQDLGETSQHLTPPISVTVYEPSGPPGEYRVLAWSEGPAQDLPERPFDRTGAAPSLRADTSTLGLTLTAIEPVRLNGHRVAMATAVTVLAAAPIGGPAAANSVLDTPFGPVELLPAFPSTATAIATPGSFFLTDANGVPVVEARYSAADVATARRALRRRTLSFASLPLVIVALHFAGLAVSERGQRSGRAAFWRASAIGVLLLTAVAAGFTVVLSVVGAPHAAFLLAGGAWALGVTAIVPISWWRRRRRRHAADGPARFVLEQIVAGAAAAPIALALAWFFARAITPDSLGDWQFPLFSSRPDSAIFLAGCLLIEAAGYWTIVTILASAAQRWRLRRARRLRQVAAAMLWLAPMFGAVAIAALTGHLVPIVPLGAAVASAAIVALTGAALPRQFRHATQATRLALLFGALCLPALVLYPVGSAYADRTAMTLVAQEYAPATADHSVELLNALAETEREIDALPDLARAQAPRTPGIPTQPAFSLWSRTALGRLRLTSSIEIYGEDRTLVSRFALNVPEYLSVRAGQMWQGTSCKWLTFGAAGRFGAEERSMLQAETGLCDANGTPRGAVVVRVMPDYRTLPFVSSDSPYYDVLRHADPTARGPRVADLQVVVYGWGLTPVFTSGTVAWPITPALFTRIYDSRGGFWTSLDAADRTYRVLITNDQGGIYAIGYPAPTLVDHLIRIAEAGTIAAVLFVALLVGAAIYGPLARRSHEPVRVLIDEVRTSFYRKLFLYFVLAAVAPVLALAVTFGGYMATKFRQDVASEAAGTVTVARRVLEESLALQERPGATTTAPPTDDVMVLIGQVINQDVNLYDGATLVATSQRDLFESGLLPTRTPAAVYQNTVLLRLPTYVGEDRLGDVTYLVAAAQVPERGADAVLSVPLALRQRDIRREIDDLNRGVLAGAVFVVLAAAVLGVYIAGRISDPVARLTRATRQIAAGRLDVRIVADTADELRRLVDDFNSMAATLASQRAELARTNQLKAWAEMARQVAHEIKNPLTPIQLAAEHLQRVHADRGRPLGDVFDQCVATILGQVRLLRQIAGEFSNFAATPTPNFTVLSPTTLVESVIAPYRTALTAATRIAVDLPDNLPDVRVDPTLIARALTNVIENALQAMPHGGVIAITGSRDADAAVITVRDTGVGMDATALARVFEPYFSTKTGGSGLGLPNALRNVELCGGTLTVASEVSRGTSVTIRLPAAPRAETASA